MKQVLRLLLIIAAASALSGCSGGEKAQLPAAEMGKAVQSPTKAVAAPETVVNDGNEYRLLGQVSSQGKIFLSFAVSGIIEKVLVKPGMKVNKGQVVAYLEQVPFKLAEESAKLQFDKATNERAKAEKDFRVEKDLREKDISSLTQFQNAELAYKNTVLAQDIAKVAYDSARVALYASTLRAPVAGTISQQFKFAGDKSENATFEMFALEEPEIYLNAPESLLTKMTVGTNLDVSFPSINLKRKAQIVRIVPAVRETDRSFLVVAKLKERDPLIVPGIFAEAIVTTPRK